MLMRLFSRLRPFTVVAAAIAAVAIAAPVIVTKAEEPAAHTLAPLAGRWVGEGRLGIKDNPPENVRCRATYIAGENADELKQTIRCASAGGKIEVIADVTNNEGTLKGTWKETMHNIAGDLEGKVTPSGFRIQVKSTELAANMDIIVKNEKQIVEIQFFDSALIGLTLMLKKG